MKKWIALLMSLTMIVACTAAPAEDASLQKVLDKGEFVLGLDDAFPPMGYRDEDGEIVGFDIDVAAEVCERLGVELKVQPVDWSTKEVELSSGAIDCIWNGLTMTEERIAQMDFSEPYLNNTQVIVVKADSPVQTLADLAGKTLAVQAGSSGVDALSANQSFADTLGDVLEFDDFMMAMMDLDGGGCDCVLIDVIVAGYYMGQKEGAYRLLDETLAAEQFAIGMRKGDGALVAAVNGALEEMAADGTLAAISTEWFGEDITLVGK